MKATASRRTPSFFLRRLTQPRSSGSEQAFLRKRFLEASAFSLTASAVKLDSEGGVHPGEVFDCVVLECTLRSVFCCGRGLPRAGSSSRLSAFFSFWNSASDQRERVLASARQRGLGVRLRTAAARVGSPAIGGDGKPSHSKITYLCRRLRCCGCQRRGSWRGPILLHALYREQKRGRFAAIAASGGKGLQYPAEGFCL